MKNDIKPEMIYDLRDPSIQYGILAGLPVVESGLQERDCTHRTFYCG